MSCFKAGLAFSTIAWNLHRLALGRLLIYHEEASVSDVTVCVQDVYEGVGVSEESHLCAVLRLAHEYFETCASCDEIVKILQVE